MSVDSTLRDVIAVIPVGPGKYEAARAARVLDSLVRHEPALQRVIMLIDGITEADLRPHLSSGPLTLTFLQNPRRGRGSGVFDGLACGLTAAFHFIAQQHPGAHAWKIDTDALVLRATSRQIAAHLAAYPRQGIVGTYATNPGGGSRSLDFARWAEVQHKFLRPLWYWRSGGGLKSPYFGKANRRFARLLRQAHTAGLEWGWHVQGGSYAINGQLLAAWLDAGRLDDPESWLGAPLSEDVAFTHWTVLDGFEPGNFNAPGDAFGVKAAGLPMLIDALVEADYGVVHSLKTADWASECALADELIRRTARQMQYQPNSIRHVGQ